MAAYAIQFRRGTTTEHSSFTGLLGEVTVDTTKNTVVVHNGSTAGGYALALEGAAVSTTTGTYSSNVTIGGTLGVTGLTTMSGAAVVTGDLTMTGHILPSANITYDLGSSSMMWKDIYVGPGSLYVNGKKVIEDDSGAINITTDINEDLKITTSGTGTLKLISANGINLTGELGATSGDIQIGDHIDMNSSLIKELATPVSGTDATNKTYVDDAASSAVTDGSNAGSFTTLTTSGNAIVGGNLTVSGTATYVNTANVTFEDNMFVLNSNATGTPTQDSGFEVERGDSLNVQFLWNETDDRWSTGGNDFHSGATITATAFVGNITGDVTGNTAGVHTGNVTGDVTGSITGTVSSLSNHLLDEDGMASNSASKVPSQQSVVAYVASQLTTQDNTDEMTEGSTNLYFTNARARTAISVSGDITYNSTTGVISTTGLASSDTDDLSEGSSNLYYTDARADARTAVATATNTTAWEAHSDASEAAAIASAESKDIARMVTSDAYADASEAAAIASAESKDIARMVTSDAYADAAELAAIASAESKDIARMVTSDAYADAAELAAIASAESKDVARMVTSDAYADASEAAAKSFATAADTTLQGTLQGNIDVENARIDAILLSADADKDTFVEIVTLINAVDTTNDTALGAEIVLRASGDTAAVASAESKDVARMVTSDAYADQAELDAIASAESKDVARASTAVSNIATAKTEAIASAESKDVARMVTSDAYADAAETAAIASAEAKDVARATTSASDIATAKAAAISTAAATAASLDTAQTTANKLVWEAYADQSEADAESTAAATAASLDTAQTTANKLVWEAYADQAETDAVATASADATAKVAVLTAGASTSLDTLLEIANVMATDTELSDSIAALNHDSLSGFVANEHIDWTADQGATNVHAGNYTDTNTTYSVGDGGLTQINFTSADNSKLDGIELLAKDDQTASEILTLIKTVDGAGSGLDADLLDGNSSAYFTGYADTAETDAVATAATAAQVKVDALESSFTHFHSAVQSVTAAQETDNTSSTTDFTFSELTNARHYVLFINRTMMRAAEYSVSGTTVTIVSGIIALDDELEVTGFSS